MYSLKITDEITAEYKMEKGESETGCQDTMDANFFIHGVEIYQEDLNRVLWQKYLSDLYEDFRARVAQYKEEQAALENEMRMDPVEWMAAI